MKNRKLLALLTAIAMALTLGAGALAEDDFEYEGDAAFMPALMLRSDPDAGYDWSGSFVKGGIAELATDYYTIEQLNESDPWNTYEGEGGYTWLRINGVSEGVDTLVVLNSDTNLPVYCLNIVVSVDADLNVYILGIGTDDAMPKETLSVSPVHPLLMLAARPQTGESWVPDNSVTEGMARESEYVESSDEQPFMGGGAELVTLMGEGANFTLATFSYARDFEDTFAAIKISVSCDEETNVQITDVELAW